jgi:glc operon protein GlcG
MVVWHWKAVAVALACGLAQQGVYADESKAGARPAANISLEQAQRVVAGAIAHARKLNVALTVVVVDSGGHVVAGARMDGVPFGTFDVARGKAIASVATGGTSGKALMERYKANPIVFGQISSLSYGGPMFPSQGSLPIFLDGLLIGAVGGSGASSQIDEDAARAGLQAIGASEK